jgi:hypothetical protein
MRTRVIVFSTIYYVGLLAALFGALFKEWTHVVPHSLATQIGHNTEGYLAALIVAVWIQFVRPKLAGTRAEWPVTIVVGLAFVGLTQWMLNGDMAPQYKTLNEGTLAAAVLIPYFQLRRPLPRRADAITTLVLVIATIATIKLAFTSQMAETIGMVILGVAGLDLVDRGILDPAAVTSAVKRWIWYAFLVIAPLLFGLWEHKWGAGTTGIIGVPVRWMVRINESFVYAILVQIFFAVLLGRTGSNGATEDLPAASVTPEPAVLV